VKPRRSFILRCLPVRDTLDHGQLWRFTLQEAESGAPTHAFNTAAEVFSFLCVELGCAPFETGNQAGT